MACSKATTVSCWPARAAWCFDRARDPRRLRGSARRADGQPAAGHGPGLADAGRVADGAGAAAAGRRARLSFAEAALLPCTAADLGAARPGRRTFACRRRMAANCAWPNRPAASSRWPRIWPKASSPPAPARQLVATVEFSEYPAAAAELPRIGDAFRLDIERIIGLAPGPGHCLGFG